LFRGTGVVSERCGVLVVEGRARADIGQVCAAKFFSVLASLVIVAAFSLQRIVPEPVLVRVAPARLFSALALLVSSAAFWLTKLAPAPVLVRVAPRSCSAYWRRW